MSDYIIGAAILGNLDYNAENDKWALKLGAKLELLLLRYEEADPNNNSPRRVLRREIDDILRAKQIPITVANLDARRTTLRDFTERVIGEIDRSKGQRVAALVWLGRCTLWSILYFDEIQTTPQPYFANIQRSCPTVGINYSGLQHILSTRRTEDDLEVDRVSQLFVQLSQPLRVLLMIAAPLDQTPFRSDTIFQGFRNAVNAVNTPRMVLSMTVIRSARPDDIAGALDSYRPHILHFVGHGNDTQLAFQDDNGQTLAINKDRLAALLNTQDGLKLVVLTACNSASNAQQIANAADYCIGTDGLLKDEDARRFCSEFYTALGAGRTFGDAFGRAKAALGLTSRAMLSFFRRQ